MNDVYDRLAKKLDNLPSGFPATESGVEIRILKNVFTAEEAEMALKMRPMPETVKAVAERLGKPVPEMQKILDHMVKRGQIATAQVGGQQVFVLLPFVIGIYEMQLNRMDKEFVDLFEEYLPHLMKTLGGFKPALGRVVPVSTEIKQDLHVHRYEDIRRMIEEAKSFQVTDCICRKTLVLEGKPCGHTLEVCMFFSNEENAFKEEYLRGRVISKEEALKIMKAAEEEGLVHCTYNIENGQIFVCNCCSCACVGLRGIKNFKTPYMFAKSNFTASIDADNCSACGVCANERCQMDAIVEENGGYRVLAERCIGCGVCVPTCPTEAITLNRRPEAECDKPPKSLADWGMKRAAERGIEVRLD
ncbi:MAG: 4Fe-4S binding protein [Candidatus Lindowbacteria bacterium]|nr:4Fe-4S binding protein [Candidatus Lindowbacteria bacterium]